ncbi:MAG: protein translocase subunit SecD, partial [Firmicutes bacterium]|nr:protein translocase subunit SecD [Bacillota bacterium]
MKKKSSIIKFSIVGVLIVIGAILSFVPIQIGVRNVNPFFRSIRLGLDLVGGVFAVYEAESVDGSVVLSEQVEGTRARLEAMIVARGFPEATVMREGETRLRVEVPNVDEPEELFRIIGEPAQLEFRDDAGNTVLTGDMVTNVSSGWDPGSATNVVHLTLNSEGTRRFANATAPENHGQSIQIVTIVDNIPTVISAPTIQTHITNGRAIITGMESPEAARSLADQILSGQMEVRLRVLETASISPTLGQGALFLGLLAGAIGLLLIILFMSFFYKVFGVLSSVALLINVILMLFFLAALPWVQLTLPGIAGILLSIGMATDGNIVMFER